MIKYYFRILDLIFELRLPENFNLPISDTLKAFQVAENNINKKELTTIEMVPNEIVDTSVFKGVNNVKSSITMHRYESNLLFETQTSQFLTNNNFTKIKLWSPYEKEISMQREGKINYNGDPSLLLILWGRASILGYCFMHGALVLIDGMYILFMGDSGVGKTTLSGLACKTGATCLTDENPYINCENGVVFTHTTPWSGAKGPIVPRSGPLAAIFFLRHSKKNEIRQLKTAEASRSILSGSRTFNWIPETIPNAIQLFDKVVKNIPVYDLGFLPDLNAISFIKNIL